MIRTIIKYFMMKYSESYHDKVTTEYWSKAPKTHGTVNEKQFAFYASQIDALMQKYLHCYGKKILDYGAGEGSIALNLKSIQINGGGYEVHVSEPFEKYRRIMREKGLNVYAPEDLPKDAFDAVYMNCAFYYIHPKKQKCEIERLLRSVKSGGYLFLTDVPTVKKIPVLYKNMRGIKKMLICVFAKMTQIYQFELGGFFVDEKKIKKCFPQTVVEDEWCDYRSFFIIKKD